MGVEFGLYCRKTKDFIWLGKACIVGFQMPDDIVTMFIMKRAYDGPFEVKSDDGHLPELTEEGWTCIAEWNHYSTYELATGKSFHCQKSEAVQPKPEVPNGPE